MQPQRSPVNSWPIPSIIYTEWTAPVYGINIYVYLYTNMCTYIYICIYLCIHIYTHTYVHIYIYIHNSWLILFIISMEWTALVEGIFIHIYKLYVIYLYMHMYVKKFCQIISVYCLSLINCWSPSLSLLR
jgi:hypothetical protein